MIGRTRNGLAVGASLVLAVTAIPGLTLAQSGGPPALLLPTIDLSTVGGPGEGELKIINWIGYAERGETEPLYDWVTAFEQQTGCKVTSKVDDTSDQMVSDMRIGDGSEWDGLSASGDASLRLIAAGDVVAIDPAIIPGFSDVLPFLQQAPHYVVGGKHYGVPHGWGGNVLMYDTATVTPAPTSWDVVFDPVASKPYFDGKLISAYDSPIYIADAALYLKSHRPDLGITDVYELTPDQLDAAVALLAAQHDGVQYWSAFAAQMDNFATGVSSVGTTWPYQVNALKAAGTKVESVVPSEKMTGWADTWMLNAKAKHPNCMLKWMAWMLTPEVQTQVAETFGEAPANGKACQFLDVGYGPYQFPGFCDLFGVNDPDFQNSISFWKTPLKECGDDRGATCTDYNEWSALWFPMRNK